MPNIIGVDLGTTFSCVGICRNGKVEIIANEHGNFTTPSYVAFTDQQKLTGEEAKNQERSNPKNTIFDVKRLMGRKFYEKSVQEDMKFWPFEVINDGDGYPKVKVLYLGESVSFAPEEISSMVLGRMIATAESFLKEPVDGAVIAIPAHFNYAQRNATRRAGELAGLKVVKLMNEPIAAAIAYGFLTDQEFNGSRHILIVDIGCGTLEVTIIETENKTIKAKSTSRDPDFGGENAANNQAESHQLNEDLVKKIMVPIQNALHVAGLELKAIDDVVLVGEWTSIPKIQKILTELLKESNIKKDIDPDQVVAYGAAIQAAKLADFLRLTVSETTELSLGIQWETDLMNVMIPRNTLIPVTISREFSTRKDNQTSCTIAVYEGERPLIKLNKMIGEFILNGITAAPAGEATIIVDFYMHDNGILSVTATEKGTETKSSLTIRTEGGHSWDKVQEMIHLAEQFHLEDIKEKQRIQAKVDFQTMCLKYKAEFRQFHKFKGIEEAMMIQHLSIIMQTLAWIDEHPDETMEQYINRKEEVEKCCHPFRNSVLKRFPWEISS